MNGRPLRFLAVTVGGWTAFRVVLLWPTITSAPALLHAVLPIVRAEPRPAPASDVIATSPPRARSSVPASALHAVQARMPLPESPRHPRADPDRVALALLGFVRFGDPEDDAAPLLPGAPRPLPTHAAASRWSGSAWLVARGGAGIAPGVIGGQLGGSQAGVRLAYALDRTRRIALAGRVTSPLGPGLREVALGVEWQPTRLPVRIVAEERIALNGGGSGPALGAVGGFGPAALPAGFKLEAYGQAGVVKRDRAEPYVDGAARAARPLATLGPAKLSLGAGLWGGAQRGAARLDVGPALALDLPLAHQPVRFSLDYRARVAGDAYPGSGVALTLGTDF